jgi:hypothetical protein
VSTINTAALLHALNSFQGCADRWDARRARGMTDAELRQAIAMEFGAHSGSSMHGGWIAVGSGPSFWCGFERGRKPDLSGKELLDAVRELLDVRVTPQGRAPWAGLPLLAGEAHVSDGA